MNYCRITVTIQNNSESFFFSVPVFLYELIPETIQCRSGALIPAVQDRVKYPWSRTGSNTRFTTTLGVCYNIGRLKLFWFECSSKVKKNKRMLPKIVAKMLKRFDEQATLLYYPCCFTPCITSITPCDVQKSYFSIWYF